MAYVLIRAWWSAKRANRRVKKKVNCNILNLLTCRVTLDPALMLGLKISSCKGTDKIDVRQSQAVLRLARCRRPCDSLLRDEVC